MSDEARDKNPGAGEQAGEAVGGIGGTLAGVAIGAAAGPIGSIIGGIAGAAGGWWAGEKAGRSLEDWDAHEPHYREHYDSLDTTTVEYDTAKVGYGVGHVAGRNPDYDGRPFTDVEKDLRTNWKYDEDYDALRPYVEAGYYRSSKHVPQTAD